MSAASALCAIAVNGQPSNAVFISYRRDVAGILAMALYQNLTEHGLDAFYDIESIRAGQFDTIILNQIAARPYFVLVLTPGTLERCDDPSDWLRREIEQALATKRVIVPVHTPNFDFGDFGRFLPAGLGEQVRRFNGQELAQKWFKYAVERLVDEFLLPIEVESPAAPTDEQTVVDDMVRQAQAAPAVTAAQLSAQEYFERALARPDDDLDGKIADYSEAIRLNPGYANAFVNRGLARASNGDLHAAIADVEDGARLAPENKHFPSLLDDLTRLVPVGTSGPEVAPTPPRWRRLGLGAGLLAAAVVAFVAVTLLNGGGSDDWSQAAVATDVLHKEDTKQELRDVTAIGRDRAVAVGSDGNWPGVWAYDGTGWSREELETESGTMNAVASSGETVVAVGSVVHAAAEGDVDGRIWTRSGDGPWTPTCTRDRCGGPGVQQIHAVAATSAGRFIAAGRDRSSGSWDAAVWLSEDGSDWQLVADDSDLGGPENQGIKGIAEHDDQLVAVGRNGPDGAAWTSDDGSDWTRVSQATFQSSGGEIELQAVETWDTSLIAVGREADRTGGEQYQAAAWFSDDPGLRWDRTSVSNAHFSGQQMADVVEDPLGLVAVGSDSSSEEGTVWRSGEGREWSAVSSDSFDAPSGMKGVTWLSSGTLFAVGTASTDGRIWFSEPEE